MAFKLLNGTDAAVDFSFGGTPTSVKCLFSSIRATLNRRSFEQTTFCSTGWVVENMGMKQLTMDLTGYVSVGNAYSDPSALFAAATPTAFVSTFDTGATYTGSANAISDTESIVAAADSGRGLQLRSSGAVTVVWPIT